MSSPDDRSGPCPVASPSAFGTTDTRSATPFAARFSLRTSCTSAFGSNAITAPIGSGRARRVDGDEAEVRAALEHRPSGRDRLGEQAHEGPLAAVLEQLADVVEAARGSVPREPDAVDVELEALERACDERRDPVDERAETEPRAPGPRATRARSGSRASVAWLGSDPTAIPLSRPDERFDLDRHRASTTLRREFGDVYGGRTVLVTGADGFMGSHLTDALVELGANVHAFVRATSSGALNNIGASAQAG